MLWEDHARAARSDRCVEGMRRAASNRVDPRGASAERVSREIDPLPDQPRGATPPAQ
jgi:hypothetical protein